MDEYSPERSKKVLNTLQKGARMLGKQQETTNFLELKISLLLNLVLVI